MPLSLELAEVQEFLAFLRLKNVTAGTIAQYAWTRGDLFRLTSAGLDRLQGVTAVHLRDYMTDLHAKGLKSKTVSDRVMIPSTLRQAQGRSQAFFGYLCAEGHLSTDPAQRLPLPKVGKRLPEALTLEETQALLLAIENDPELGRRDRVLIVARVDSQPTRKGKLIRNHRGYHLEASAFRRGEWSVAECAQISF